MIAFPNTYAETLTPLPADLGEVANAARTRLEDKGFVVMTGLTRNIVNAIGIMGAQRHIREYCPKDAREARFATEVSAEEWLKKPGGREMFILAKRLGLGLRLAGYGWTGPEPCKELPDHSITSAYRLGEESQGQHLGKDFTKLVVHGTAVIHDVDDIGLETWQSNVKAVGLYEGVGFEFVTKKPGEKRETLDENVVGGIVLDTRRFYGFPAELLPTAA